MNLKITTEKFIEKARKIHGNTYDYSLINYVNKRTKIIIICKIHGQFEQFSGNHLRGNGCFKCSHRKKSNKQIVDSNVFILRLKNIHGDKYDYSLVDYKGYRNKIEIVCSIHGRFLQEAGAHLKGQGCPTCGEINRRISSKFTIDEFINRAREIHGNRYDYSLVKYVSINTKIKIICPIDGEFYQLPSGHLSGNNCPHCSNNRYGFSKSKFFDKLKTRNAFLYLIRCWNKEEEFYKIGITSREIKDRFKGKEKMPYLYETINIISRENEEIWELEKYLHNKYKEFKYLPKIKFGGKMECFNLNLPIEEIIQLNTCNL